LTLTEYININMRLSTVVVESRTIRLDF